MLLKSISLHNIRSYESEKITFEQGSSLLLGDIGSGKTTVLLGIEFALFGLIKGDVTGTTLLRHGTNEGSVELEFEIQGAPITISRRLKRKKDTVSQDSGYIIIKDTKLELTPVELKSKILEMFGYPEDMLNKNTSLIYRYTVYTPQEEMKNILYETREERLDILRKIFNIDKYKRIRENALIYAKELRTTKKILETKLVSIEDLKIKLEANIAQLQTQKDIQKILTEQISQANNLLADKESKLNELSLTIENINTLKQETAVLDANLKAKKQHGERIEKDLNMVNYRIKEYENKLIELGVIDQDEEALRANLKDSEDKLTKISTAKETIKERLASKQNDLRSIASDDSLSMKLRHEKLSANLRQLVVKITAQEEKKKASDLLSIEINTIKINNLNSKKIVDNLAGLSVCPTCMQEVDFKHKITITDRENLSIHSNEKSLKSSQEKKAQTDSDLAALKSEIEALHKDEIELRSLEVKMQSAALNKEKKESLQKEIADLLEKKAKIDAMDINKLIESISKNRKILINIGAQKHILESLDIKRKEKETYTQQFQTHQEESKSLIEQFSAKLTELETFASTENEFKTITNERNQLQNTMRDLQIKQSLAAKDIETLTREGLKIDEDVAINLKLNEKIGYMSDLNHWLNDYFIDLASIIEKNIMHTIHREFNELFKEWFSIIVEDQDLDVQIDEDFAPSIRQNNYDTTINNLSGGEKTAVALAYRLALNKVINDFINNIKTKDLLILDEPTDGFSSQQLDRMRDVLDALRVKQLIIVSHEAKMESYAENIIRISKNNHVSEAS